MVLLQYLQQASNCHNLEQLRVLMEALKNLVDNQNVPARLLCDRVLLNDKLTFDNKNFWIESFKLIKKVMPSVDYKGVREILKSCREKAFTFPDKIKISDMPQIMILEDTIQHIFDRNNCLLPAYFVANEILKSSQTHWKIKRLVTDFIEDFRKTAQMVSIIGRNHMLPVIEPFGYADHMMNSWKLDHDTLNFNFKGILPYEPELLKPQKQLFRYVIEQPYSREMILSMLSLPKQTKQRCNALEGILVELILTAMENTVEVEDTSEEMSPTDPIWLHISTQLIYFVLFQYVNFQFLVNYLHEKLAKSGLRRGRDQLMWVLLQFISGSIQKNPVSFFAKLNNRYFCLKCLGIEFKMY